MIALIITLINTYYIAFTSEGFIKNLDALMAAVVVEFFVYVFIGALIACIRDR